MALVVCTRIRIRTHKHTHTHTRTHSEIPEDEQVVLDLVHSFLLPEVEKETRRRAERNADTTLLLAAHQAVHAELNRLAEEDSSKGEGSSKAGPSTQG
jgi:hypothetical protein